MICRAEVSLINNYFIRFDNYIVSHAYLFSRCCYIISIARSIYFRKARSHTIPGLSHYRPPPRRLAHRHKPRFMILLCLHSLLPCCRARLRLSSLGSAFHFIPWWYYYDYGWLRDGLMRFSCIRRAHRMPLFNAFFPYIISRFRWAPFSWRFSFSFW